MATVEIDLLGRFDVRTAGRQVCDADWVRRSAASLVKLLALRPSRTMHREQVIDALWPDVSIDDAAPRLHKAAHYARKALGNRDAVVLRDDSVTLLPRQDVVVDTDVFVAAARTAVDSGS